MVLFLYVLAGYDPDDCRAYPAYACSDLRLDPDDAAGRDAILRLMAQGHGHPDDGDYAAVVRTAYARLREEGGELDRHALAAPLPDLPPDRVRAALRELPSAATVWGDQARPPSRPSPGGTPGRCCEDH